MHLSDPSSYTLAAWPCEPAPLHWARPAAYPLPAVATAAPARAARPPADEQVRAMVAELAALALDSTEATR